MRRKTNLVKIGNIEIGGNKPIMIQSMLNTPTMDTEACVQQSIKIINAGGQLVRITAQGVKEAENLKSIRLELTAKGYDTPISADIHFNPEAALIAAKYVEKVRINPGNFADKRAVFKRIDFTDAEYAEELCRMENNFIEFLNVCKEHNTAIRIGTNHGSLSDRILSRYGNTERGMVESTMEYLRVVVKENFSNVVISLKSSDVVLMIHAVRMLVKSMDAENMHFPIHLGVTEAGEGEDGRIKSAIGIGTLLNEGIGDTIRVSLTEAPENEIPVAKQLIEICKPSFKEITPYTGNFLKPEIYTSSDIADMEQLCNIASVQSEEELTGGIISALRDDHMMVLIIAPPTPDYNTYRNVILKIMDGGIKNRIIVKAVAHDSSKNDANLTVAAHVGGIFADRLAYGIWIETPNISDASFPTTLAQNIFQAVGLRRYKAEFVSCPGCGRTLYDLQSAVAKVKQRFAGQKKLKIAIMGCVVNGPGEMGDADYGYVGAGDGKVNIFKGQQMIHAAVPEDAALDILTSLIKENGDWTNE